MMSYSVKNSISDQAAANNATTNAGNCCSKASSELKLYQAFIFSVPIIFTFILLFLFYLFYLRRRRVNWSSLRMRAGDSTSISAEIGDEISRCELGLKKEVREMLPVVVFNESFSVKDTQCSVCLGEYQADDRLQQIPVCGHTFHMDCIDLWLATHTTCPLCRQSLLASSSSTKPVTHSENNEIPFNPQNGDETSHHTDTQSSQDPQSSHDSPDTRNRGERVVLTVCETDEVIENSKDGCTFTDMS